MGNPNTKLHKFIELKKKNTTKKVHWYQLWDKEDTRELTRTIIISISASVITILIVLCLRGMLPSQWFERKPIT